MSTVDELTRHLKEFAARAAGRVFPPASSNVVWLHSERSASRYANGYANNGHLPAAPALFPGASDN